MGEDAFFSCQGKKLTIEQLHDFDVAPGGKYIVGVEPMEALDGVVTSFEKAFDTRATSKMFALGMFVAELNQQQIAWLLMNKQVQYVECDGVVSMVVRP
eukprot:CAMPEP_0198209112 /NCGR_PEP_ID=MMETSP1445-20131203/12422_1 /TAXON_ID=36898 /ORGANISM="Pyramimonas sp., Strain CCMP2087" /LENGTH=98 /DNA_ID=CAMNT_0043882749 /DNA_START=888 /DNA_END=1184 /DNA_ORIENTATION=+